MTHKCLDRFAWLQRGSGCSVHHFSYLKSWIYPQASTILQYFNKCTPFRSSALSQHTSYEEKAVLRLDIPINHCSSDTGPAYKY